MEEWKDIKGLEGRYQVSNMGRVRSLRFRNNIVDKPRNTPKILKPNNNGHYDFFVFGRTGERKRAYVHRLVAEHFIDNPNGYPVVNHIDFDKKNNNVDNLEWCTVSHNVLHSVPDKSPYRRRKKMGDRFYITERHIRTTVKYEVTVKLKYLGHFDTLEEAKRVRDSYMREIGWLNQ